MLGFVAVHRGDGFRKQRSWRSPCSPSVLTHVVDLVENDNVAPGNTIQNIANLVRPALLFFTLRATRTVDARSVPSARHAAVSHAALWAMASAATGFGIGYGIGAPALGAAIGAIVALTITRQVALAASAKA